MNEVTPENTSASSQSMSAFLPLTVLAVSFALFLVSQISNLLTVRSSLVDSNGKFLALKEQRNQIIKQTPQLEARLAKLFTDILTLAKDNKEAQDIVARSGIQLTLPQPGADANGSTAKPSSSPAATPEATPAPTPAK